MGNRGMEGRGIIDVTRRHPFTRLGLGLVMLASACTSAPQAPPPAATVPPAAAATTAPAAQATTAGPTAAPAVKPTTAAAQAPTVAATTAAQPAAAAPVKDVPRNRTLVVTPWGQGAEIANPNNYNNIISTTCN